MNIEKTNGFSILGVLLCALTIPFSNAAGQGFSGNFAPSNWGIGSNPQSAKLVDTSKAPASVTLKDYPTWGVSGAVFSYTATQAGTVIFSFSATRTSTGCPATYFVGNQPTFLKGSNGVDTFSVVANQKFGFALNGQLQPTNFGCSTGAANISFTVSNFSFTNAPVPSGSGFSGQFAASKWTQTSSVAGLIDTSGVPNSIKLQGILTSTIGGAKASFIFPKAPSAGTVTFSYSFPGEMDPNCWAQKDLNNVPTNLRSSDQATYDSIKVMKGDSFGFSLAGPDTYNNGCQVSPQQVMPFPISQFIFTPKL